MQLSFSHITSWGPQGALLISLGSYVNQSMQGGCWRRTRRSRERRRKHTSASLCRHLRHLVRSTTESHEGCFWGLNGSASYIGRHLKDSRPGESVSWSVSQSVSLSLAPTTHQGKHPEDPSYITIRLYLRNWEQRDSAGVNGRLWRKHWCCLLCQRYLVMLEPHEKCFLMKSVFLCMDNI